MSDKGGDAECHTTGGSCGEVLGGKTAPVSGTIDPCISTLFLKVKAATPAQTHCCFDPSVDFVLGFLVLLARFWHAGDCGINVFFLEV